VRGRWRDGGDGEDEMGEFTIGRLGVEGDEDVDP